MLISRIISTDGGAKDFFYISDVDDREYLVNLLQHTAGHDSFVRYMTEINFDVLKKHYLAAAGKQTADE